MSDRDAFERSMASLYDAMLDDTRWPVASALIDEACGLTGNGLVVGDPADSEGWGSSRIAMITGLLPHYPAVRSRPAGPGAGSAGPGEARAVLRAGVPGAVVPVEHVGRRAAAPDGRAGFGGAVGRAAADRGGGAGRGHDPGRGGCARRRYRPAAAPGRGPVMTAPRPGPIIPGYPTHGGASSAQADPGDGDCQAVTIKADGRTPTKARRRPPRRWSPGFGRQRPSTPTVVSGWNPCPPFDFERRHCRSGRGPSRRPPPGGATTPAIASRSLLFEQIPSVFEQVASAALVTSSPGRGARQLARRRPCFPELQVELSGARRVAVAAAAVGEGSGGNRRRDSACVPRCATTSRCRRPRTPGVVGDSDEDGATLVSG